MFTVEQIKAAHSKVKSGADFPKYIQELKQLGVVSYESFVTDGHTDYSGRENFKTSSPPKYAALQIASFGNNPMLERDLKLHQQGKSDYPTFCLQAANAGVEKWIVDLEAMTCTYYDKLGKKMLEENVPSV